MASNHTKKQSHGLSRVEGSGNDNRSNHHLQAKLRSESGADAELTNTEAEGNEKKILFQIEGIVICEVYNDHLKADAEAIDGLEISMASTSPSLSSSSSTSSDDMIELKAKDAKLRISEKNHQKQSLSYVSSGSSESQGSPDNNTPRSQVSVVTNASLGSASLSPMQSPPVQVMDREEYDPQRIPSSIFEKSGGLDWSSASNESLFSLNIGNNSLARDRELGLVKDHVFRYSDFKPEELLKSGELLAYSPSLPIHPEDSEGKTSDGEEQMSEETESTVETDSEEKSSVPVLWWRDLSELHSLDRTLNSSNNSDQTPPSLLSFSSPIPRKSKKKKKTTKTTKKKKKNRCCLCCCFSCGNNCFTSCCKNTRACCCCCRCPTCRGCFSCCKWPKWSCCDCFSCRSCCRWPKLTCCCSCSSCCFRCSSCHRCCCYR